MWDFAYQFFSFLIKKKKILFSSWSLFVCKDIEYKEKCLLVKDLQKDQYWVQGWWHPVSTGFTSLEWFRYRFNEIVTLVKIYFSKYWQKTGISVSFETESYNLYKYDSFIELALGHENLRRPFPVQPIQCPIWRVSASRRVLGDGHHRSGLSIRQLGSLATGTGVDFINILCAAFPTVDHKSAKIYWQLDWIFTLLVSALVKAQSKHVVEIAPRLSSSLTTNGKCKPESSGMIPRRKMSFCESTR